MMCFRGYRGIVYQKGLDGREGSGDGKDKKDIGGGVFLFFVVASLSGMKYLAMQNHTHTHTYSHLHRVPLPHWWWWWRAYFAYAFIPILFH